MFLLSSLIGGWVRRSRLNALDRSLGMVAGIATSILLISGAYLVMENILPENKRQKFIKDAKGIPVLRNSNYTKFRFYDDDDDVDIFGIRLPITAQEVLE